jgi:hypothetical protein
LTQKKIVAPSVPFDSTGKANQKANVKRQKAERGRLNAEAPQAEAPLLI